MEDLKVSEEYKKAYNHADMICRFMPHLLKDMKIPEKEPGEYTKGFQDRIKQFEKERQIIKSFSRENLREKYASILADQYKGQDKDIEKEKEK